MAIFALDGKKAAYPLAQFWVTWDRVDVGNERMTSVMRGSMPLRMMVDFGLSTTYFYPGPVKWVVQGTAGVIRATAASKE